MTRPRKKVDCERCSGFGWVFNKDAIDRAYFKVRSIDPLATLSRRERADAASMPTGTLLQHLVNDDFDLECRFDCCRRPKQASKELHDWLKRHLYTDRCYSCSGKGKVILADVVEAALKADPARCSNKRCRVASGRVCDAVCDVCRLKEIAGV